MSYLNSLSLRVYLRLWISHIPGNIAYITAQRMQFGRHYKKKRGGGERWFYTYIHSYRDEIKLKLLASKAASNPLLYLKSTTVAEMARILVTRVIIAFDK